MFLLLVALGPSGLLICLLMLVMLLACEFSENGIGSTLTLIAGVFLLWWVAELPVFGWIKIHQNELLIASAVYFPIGTMWATFKWYLYLLESRRDLLDRKKNYIKNHGEDGWKEFVQSSMPKAAHKKYDIIRWIIYWPISVILILIDDLAQKIGTAIYNVVGDFFNNISKKVFKDV